MADENSPIQRGEPRPLATRYELQRLFSPSTKSLEGIDVEAIPSLQEQPVQSAILCPSNKNNMVHTVEAGDIIPVKGYAYSGGGRGIVRVDISIDGGKTWKTAELTEKQQPMNRAWAWTFWETDIEVPRNLVGKKKNGHHQQSDGF